MRHLLLFVLCTAMITLAHSQKPVLNHIALNVVDLAKSSRFYQEVIGLDTIPEPFHDKKHIWLNLGGKAQLHLIADGTPNTYTKPNHICFSISSMDSFLVRLSQWKIPFEDYAGKPGAVTTRPDGVKQIYFQDPDGRWIEVNDAK